MPESFEQVRKVMWKRNLDREAFPRFSPRYTTYFWNANLQIVAQRRGRAGLGRGARRTL